MANAKIIGSYIYNQAFGVIDYCGNIDKGGAYSEYYSPNNIRRIIVSPDAIVAEFYISVPSVGKSKTVRIPCKMLEYVAGLPDYKPIIKIISTERICSSLEEVVFLTRSNDGSVFLSGVEYDFQSMVANYNSRSGDILDTIKRRYVRLKYITIIEGSFNQFNSMERNSKDFVAEREEVEKYSRIQKIHEEDDWYKKWGSPAAAKSYPTMDGQNGHLWNYFNKFIAKYEEDLKKSKVQNFQKDKYSKESEEFKKVVKTFQSIERLSIRYKKARQVSGSCSLGVPDYEICRRPNILYTCPELKDAGFMDLRPANGKSLGEIYRLNKEELQLSVRTAVVTLTQSINFCIKNLVSQHPITAKVIFSGRDVSLIDLGDTDVAQAVDSVGGHYKPIKSTVQAYINACELSGLIFMRHDMPEFEAKFAKREFWEGGVLK